MTVHPRVCGEQTSSTSLIFQRFLPLKKSTKFFVRHNHRQYHFSFVKEPPVSSTGKKETSLAPSKSTGIRRFLPKVTKSNPASVLVRQIITALPSSMPTSTCFQR